MELLTAPTLPYFSEITDPRMDRCKLHKLEDILIITLCAVLCGADNWVSIELFGKSKEAWFRSFLELPSGIPSHDTFGNVFSIINFDQFEKGFTRWVDLLSNSIPEDIIAIDGKTLRHSFYTSAQKAAIHMISAWSHANNMVLGQLKIDAKTNEITAVPELLKTLIIKGNIVTVDALNTQKAIAHEIIAQEADYVMALKGNHPELYDHVRTYLDVVAQT
jgi:predicted transposase YbfD/YdcC